MLEELRSRTLTEAAVDLQIAPFEVMRLLVATDATPERLRLPSVLVEDLREFAGIERWWTDDAAMPDDPNPRRRRVRAALGLLLSRGYIGERTTRIDNLWRGLSAAEQLVLEQAVELLVSAGHLTTSPSAAGAQIAVDRRSVKHIEGIATGSVSSPAIDALCKS